MTMIMMMMMMMMTQLQWCLNWLLFPFRHCTETLFLLYSDFVQIFQTYIFVRDD